jgi:CubicO group peptidase (beta-lactamase class C family)
VEKIRYTISRVFFGAFFLASFFISAQSLEKTKWQQDSSLLLKRSNYFSDNPKLTAMDLLVDSVVRTFMESPENCGISLAVSVNGQDFFYNYGEVRRQSDTPVSRHTIYESGSVGATFCAALLAKAVEENKINLDDDIRLYLPEKLPALQYERKPIRVRHLASHTSGLPHIPENLIVQQSDYAEDLLKTYSKENLYTYLQTFSPAQEPGSTFAYSACGLVVLACILEEVYHSSFDKLVQEKLCQPLGLQNTGLYVTEMQLQNMASGYSSTGDPVPSQNLGIFSAAAGLKISAADALLYLKAHLPAEIAWTALVKKQNFSAPRQQVGLLWYIKKTKQGNTLFYQSGGNEGYAGFTGFIEEKKCAVVVLANSDTNLEYMAISLLNYLQR